jgi:nitrogen regulatory protein PII
MYSYLDFAEFRTHLTPVKASFCLRSFPMKMLIAVIKPHKLDDVREALNTIGVTGMTVTEVRGYGRQKGQTEMYEGAEAATGFVNKLKLDVCVEDKMADAAAEAITKAAGSGKIGDGKIFIYNVEQVIRIRTGEKGAAAV